MLAVDLGGGSLPKPGYANVDRCETADIQVDFETEHLPFEDASVDALYSSHMIEHVRNLVPLMREIVRICKAGAPVEIRVPHWGSSMAMCHDHKQTIAEEQIDHWCRSAIPYWFGGCERRLRHDSTEYVPSGRFEEAKSLFPHLTREQVMRFIPDTCHEIRYKFTVIPYAS